jgi:hypothetical protein
MLKEIKYEAVYLRTVKTSRVAGKDKMTEN